MTTPNLLPCPFCDLGKTEIRVGRHDRYKSRASTHADGCWSWGPGHYECAVREIKALRAERDELVEQLRLATIAEAIAEAEANDAAIDRERAKENGNPEQPAVPDFRDGHCADGLRPAAEIHQARSTPYERPVEFDTARANQGHR